MKESLNFFIDKINQNHPFTFVDIGAMGGIPKKWNLIKDKMMIIGFEPDLREFEHLNAQRKSNEVFLNCALYDQPKDLTLYLTRDHGRSSVYRPNLELLSLFENVDRFRVVDEIKIPASAVKTFDLIMEAKTISDIDFIKIDTQGSELAILRGAQQKALHRAFGLQLEVEFIEMYKNQPVFHQVDEFMDKNGFQLIDIRRQYWKRKSCYNYSGHGQMIFGEALYFKKLESLRKDIKETTNQNFGQSKIYKSILACLVYRLFDYAQDVAKIGFDEKVLSKAEYEQATQMIKELSSQGFIGNFPGKTILYKIFNRIAKILKPNSYLGWSDSDRKIGNIDDL